MTRVLHNCWNDELLDWSTEWKNWEKGRRENQMVSLMNHKKKIYEKSVVVVCESFRLWVVRITWSSMGLVSLRRTGLNSYASVLSWRVWRRNFAAQRMQTVITTYTMAASEHNKFDDNECTKWFKTMLSSLNMGRSTGHVVNKLKE